MSRIPLSTDLKTRTGAPDKDARLKNCYVEVRGESSAVRRRPSAQGGVAVGSGVAQGGIGFNIAGTDYFIGVWGDTITPYTGGGTTWDSGTAYSIGDHVSVGFVDYWALTDNTNSDPITNPSDWSDGYVPAVPFSGTYATWDATKSSSYVIITDSDLGVYTPANSTDPGTAKSTIGKSSGKWYWEITRTIGGADSGITGTSMVGVSTSPNILNSYLNFGGYSYSINWADDHRLFNGIEYIVYGVVCAQGDIIGIALNMDDLNITFYVNGISQGVACSVISGTLYAGVSPLSGRGSVFAEKVTANFGASPFAYPVPIGYNPGLYTP